MYECICYIKQNLKQLKQVAKNNTKYYLY